MQLFELTATPLYDDATIAAEGFIMAVFDNALDALDMREHMRISEIEVAYPDQFIGLQLSIVDTENKDFYDDHYLTLKELYEDSMYEDLIVQTKALVTLQNTLAAPVDDKQPIDVLELREQALKTELKRLTKQVEDTFWRLQFARSAEGIMVNDSMFDMESTKMDFLDQQVDSMWMGNPEKDRSELESASEQFVNYWYSAPILRYIEVFEGGTKG